MSFKMSRIKQKTDLLWNPEFTHRFQIRRIIFHCLLFHVAFSFYSTYLFSFAFISYFGTEFRGKEWPEVLIVYVYCEYGPKNFSNSPKTLDSYGQNT